MTRAASRPAPLHVRQIDLGRLHSAPWNANRVTPAMLEKVRRSVTTFGVVENLVARPLETPCPVCSSVDGCFEVVSGNHRLEIYGDVGMTSAPVHVVELDDARARLLAQTLNRTRGADDPDALREALEVMLAELGVSTVLDFLPETEHSIDAILKAAVPPNFETMPPPRRAKSKRGEVYELGEHRVMCGDSTSVDDVATLMNGELAKLVLADPPYGVDYHGGTMNKAQRSSRGAGAGQKRGRRADAYVDQFADYRGFLTSVLEAGYAMSEPKAALMIWLSTSRLRDVHAAMDAAKWIDRSFIVWDKQTMKGGIGQAGKQYRSRFEPLLHCHKRGQAPYWYGPGNESDIWPVPAPMANPLHPTMKPVELYERTLKNHSRPAEPVLELFGGSGTALVAAELRGRRAHLMEIEPRFVDVIRARYAELVERPELAP